MSIRTKAALNTLAFIGVSIGVGLSFIVLGYFFGEKVALLTFSGMILSYLTWVIYDYNVRQLEFEEKFLKK